MIRFGIGTTLRLIGCAFFKRCTTTGGFQRSTWHSLTEVCLPYYLLKLQGEVVLPHHMYSSLHFREVLYSHLRIHKHRPVCGCCHGDTIGCNLGLSVFPKAKTDWDGAACIQNPKT